MSERATSTFEVTNWDEQTIDEGTGGCRLARASVTKTFHGDLEGEGTLEYVILHRDDGTADFVGMERVTGRLGHRTGSFVLQHAGTFEGGLAKGTCEVVAGSGTGELEALRGTAQFAAEGRSAPLTLDYDFE